MASSSNEVKECRALKKGAENAAEIINDFVRQSMEILEESKVNARRKAKGLLPANAILPRDAGNKLPKLPKKKKWAAIVGMPLEIGIAELAGMKILKVKYPPITYSDAYEHLYESLNAEIRDSLKYLKSQWKKFDAFYIHIKETDIPGHDGLPEEKRKCLN